MKCEVFLGISIFFTSNTQSLQQFYITTLPSDKLELSFVGHLVFCYLKFISSITCFSLMQ